MKKRIVLATFLSLVFGLSAAAFGYRQMSTTPTAVTCCDMDECCCKGDSCPMKKNTGAAAAGDKDCCCSGHKSKVVKTAV